MAAARRTGVNSQNVTAVSRRARLEIVVPVSVFPDSSSATPLRPAWSTHGSTRTPNDQLSAKITDHAIRAATWRGKIPLKQIADAIWAQHRLTTDATPRLETQRPRHQPPKPC